MADPKTIKELWFGKTGYYNNLPSQVDPTMQALLKATDPFSYSASTTWFDPVYLGKLMLEGLTRSKTLFSALRKTTYQTEGDSYQVIAADSHDGLGNIVEGGALFSSYSNPSITDVDMIYPAILKYDWINNVVAAEMSAIQRSRSTPNIQQLRDYVSNKFLDAIERQLTGTYNNPTTVNGVDDLATAGSVAQFECLDRMITDHLESGATNMVNSADDGDIWWDSVGDGTSSDSKFDRSASEGDATIRVPSAGEGYVEQAYNICDELDDLMAKCLVYAEEPYNYVAFMSPKAYNKIKAENDPKALITDYTDARQTINGVSTTPGVAGGKVQLSAIRLSDIKVPIITVPHLMGDAPEWVWQNTVFATGGSGNVYLANMDCMEFRTLIPITYRAVQTENALQTKHTLFMAGQLIAKNWKSHGALKYIA